MNKFTIKDLENLTGIKAHTIRIWEQRYSFIKPQRTDTNIRYYSNDELKSILNIALLNKYGYKISYIDKMSPADIREKTLAITNTQAQQERMINDLIHAMVDLDMDKFEELVDDYIDNRGIDKAITQLLFPFLDRIGILWVTNHINPAQEHLVTNLIRQKLIVGIESVYSHVQLEKTVLLFLPEGEHHELGLLYMDYILKSRGIKSIYIGANVPIKDVEFVAKLKKPDYLYTHLTTVNSHFNFEKFLMHLETRLAEFPVIVSGMLTHTYKKRVPEGVSFKQSLSEVLEYVSGISGN